MSKEELKSVSCDLVIDGLRIEVGRRRDGSSCATSPDDPELYVVATSPKEAIAGVRDAIYRMRGTRGFE